MLRDFFEQIAPLGGKTGPVLFQLPPSLAFRGRRSGRLPRPCTKPLPRRKQPSSLATKAGSQPKPMNSSSVTTSLASQPIPLKAAPPLLTLAAIELWPTIVSTAHREPTTPAMTQACLTALADKIKTHPNTWVIFDNTTLGHAPRKRLATAFSRLKSLFWSRGHPTTYFPSPHPKI